MNNTLENHKFFPYIAWATVVGFAVFVYVLTINVSKDLENINSQIATSEKILETNNLDLIER